MRQRNQRQTLKESPHPRALAGTRPTAQKWAEILATARHRRAPHMWPPPRQQTLRAEPIIGGALVRAYVLPEDERTRTLATPSRENQ